MPKKQKEEEIDIAVEAVPLTSKSPTVRTDASSGNNKNSIHRVTMSVASRSTQSFHHHHHPSTDGDASAASLLQGIPLLKPPPQDGTSNTTTTTPFLPHFPSGFWLEILAERSLSLDELNSLVDHWRDRRVLTTPTQGAVWDREEIGTAADGGDASPQFYRHQLFLPTTGAAWSIDAWQQTMQALLPSCNNNSNRPKSCNFMGVSAREWSRLLVEGGTHHHHHKQFWIQWTTSGDDNNQGGGSVNIGLQFQAHGGTEEGSDLQKILPSVLFSEEASCPLATRSIQRIAGAGAGVAASASSSATSASRGSTATLEQVVRRPAASPNHGRLETWFSYSPSSSSSLISSSRQPPQDDCTFQLRQKLPYFLAPQWQSLQIITSNDDDSGGNNDDDDDEPDTDELFTASVEWDDSDLSAVLRIVSSSHNNKIPTSLVVSLDYEPAMLSIDEFPGDPNRGRELPPAVVTIQCYQSQKNHHHRDLDLDPQATASMRTATSSSSIPLYSNAVLVLPPVPDMSMPFNVLSLSCSLYAYLIGTILTLLVKRSSERIKYQLHPEQKPPSKLKQFKAKIVSKIQSLRKKKTKKLESEEEEEGGGGGVTHETDPTLTTTAAAAAMAKAKGVENDDADEQPDGGRDRTSST